jgi:aspartyl-tRNA(Asn)/glutamyl-tRNA(Gln) amidotransferase subunit A
MDDDDLAYLPVAQLAPLIERREISPVELVTAQLARIEKLDRVLRAYIDVDGDQAMAHAKAAEAEIAHDGYRGPLHGVTVAHKDIIDVQGTPTTAASRILRDAPPASSDATVQAKLRAAGAICLGKLNLFEFASGSMEVFGFTRNPHNLAASPDGSSSGSGVAAAAGLATIVTGTDTGGSVRLPSCFNGITGLRPTYGRVSRAGCVPLSWGQDTIGPMGRRVEDLALALNVLAGADPRDPTAADHEVPDFTDGIDGGIAGVRVGVPEAFFYDDLDPEVDAGVGAALERLGELGAVIAPIHVPACEYASAASWTTSYTESFAFHEATFHQRARDYTSTFYRKITAAGLMSAVERIVAQQIGQVVTRSLMTALQGVDVIATPANRAVASTRGDAVTGRPRTLPWSGDMANLCRPASLAGLPALALPVGFAADRTGIALQLIGKPFDEATLFRVGHAYEQATKWFDRRPSDELPDELPVAYGAVPDPPPAETTGPATPEWVLATARLLGYDFVTEDDALVIAPLLSGVKQQLHEATSVLSLDLEPPTRPSGWY